MTQRLGRTARRLAGLLSALAITGCGAISALDSASESLATYALAPPPRATAGPARGGPTVIVDEPAAGTALATDRILIRPGALQIAYLADGRWVDTAPMHVQGLLATSLADTGRFGFVTTRSRGPLPDYALLTDLEAFEAQISPATPQGTLVVVRMTLTLVREPEGRIVAARRFERSVPAPEASAAAIVPAFEAAMRPLLAEAANWASGVLTGAPAS